MKKSMQFALMAIAFSFFAFSADSVMAQGKGNLKANKQDRKEYKREVKQARKEYKHDVKEARREYRADRRNHRKHHRHTTAPPYGRAYGYRNVRPYVGNRRARHIVLRPTKRGYVVRKHRQN